MAERTELDVVIVGAGFAGLYLLHSLRREGFSARVLEAGGGVGGTWYWNRYPGARCDVQSMEYSYGFDVDLEQEWEWTERYATQAEILRYLDHVADRFDLRRDIQLNTRVTAARFDEITSTWGLETEDGSTYAARFVVVATGCLSSANVPDIPGRDTFEGRMYHTGHWPHGGVDLGGQRVGVIGTGSSGVQAIPLIAQEAAELTVFQRTATYAVPAHNRALSPERQDEVKARYREVRAENRRNFTGYGALSSLTPAPSPATEMTPDEIQHRLEEGWEVGGLAFLGALPETIATPEVNEVVAEFVRGKIRSIVQDPAVAELLAPKHVIGCKRLCVDSGYYETYNRPNVHLVDISEHGIEGITPKGVRANGEDHELDVIVFATGFDAMTGALMKIHFEGVGGRTLAEAWQEGPKTYLGLAAAGFPNLFLVTGPGSPSVLTNMVTSIEHHVEWITQCLRDLRAGGNERIEADAAAVEDWVRHVNGVAGLTLLSACSSWYLGANIPGKPRVFMPLPDLAPYIERCTAVAERGYEGFSIDGRQRPGDDGSEGVDQSISA